MKKGISLISLIITIIVIIILAAIVLFSGLGAPDSARFAKYTQQVDNFQTAVQEEYATRTTKYSVNDQSRSDAQVYYTIATGNEVEVNTKTEDLRTGTIEELGLALKPTGLDGNEYFEVTPNTSIAGKKDNKGLYQALGTAEKHYITDRGEFFVLPGYRYYDNDGRSKWYVTAGKYYESEEGITGPLNIQISEVKITKDSAGTEEVTGTLEKGNESAYIHFSVNVEGGTAEISPAVPYEISDNGEYTFTITASVDGMTRTTTKTVSVVNMFVQMTDGSIFDFDTGAGKIKGLKSNYYTLNGSEKIVPDELCELNIPSKINGRSVLSINQRAFQYYTNITSVSIPSSVTSIGDNAFYNCSNLSRIIIPSSVTDIGESAFMRCSSLSNVTIPSGITKLKANTFAYCSGITSIDIPSNITSIDGGVFQSTSIESIIIPEGVPSIGNATFRYCSKLKNITIPGSVTSIGVYVFLGCSQLESISIPSNVTSIGIESFEECKKLKSIIIPEGMTKIDQGLFQNCSNLIEIKLPSTIKGKIAAWSFYGCSSLKTISIPSGVTELEGSSFSRCSSLKSITIPLSVTTIGNAAFYKCNNLQDVYYEGTEEQWNAVTKGSDNQPLISATIHYNSTGPTNP